MTQFSFRGWLLLGAAGLGTAFHAPRLSETLEALNHSLTMQEQMWSLVLLVHALVSGWSFVTLSALIIGARLGWLIPASVAALLFTTPSAFATPSGLDGLPFPDLPVSETRQPEPETKTITVQAGDSLWSIAAARLPHGASHDRIATEVDQLYRAHRMLIGPDPDLILPGQRLTVRRSLS